MKHIKTLTILLLTNSFSMNEVTWKEIETEIKPHIEDIEFDFSEIKQEIDKIQKEQRILSGEAEFDNLNLETETTTKGFYRATKSDKRENKKKLIETKKKNNKTDKEAHENYKKQEIEKIKNNIQKIIENKDKLEIDGQEITLKEIKNPDIEKIKKDFTAIKNINEKINSLSINKLKTFSELEAFTKEFIHAKHLKEKVYNENYLYNLVFTAITKKIAIPFLNIPEKEANAEKIASSFYLYETAFKNFLIFDYDFHKIVMKNVLNETKINEQKEILKDKYKRILEISVFTALSNKQDKKTLEEYAPAILTMLETLKGTEEENKKMNVKKAIEIFHKFISLANKESAPDKTQIREQKEEIPNNNFDQKQNKRIEKLNVEIEKLKKEKETIEERIEKEDATAIENFNKIKELSKKLKTINNYSTQEKGEEIANSLGTLYENKENKKEKIIFAEADNFISFIEDQNIKKIATEINEIMQKTLPKTKDLFKIEKEINALENTINKIKREEYKEQTHINAKTEENRAKIALEKTKRQGKQKKQSAETNSKDKQQKATKGKWAKNKEERTAQPKGEEGQEALKKGKASTIAKPNFNTINENDTKEAREKKLEEKKLRKNEINNFINSKKYRDAISFINKIQNEQEKNELKEYFDGEIEKLNIKPNNKKKIKALTEKKINNEEETGYKEENIDQLFI